MRLFVALLFSDGFRDHLSGMMRAMRRAGVTGNYTRAENLHLTLAFIGETDRAEDAKAALDSVSLPPVTLTLSVTGHFGDLLWAGLERTQALTLTADTVAAALREKGFRIEKRAFTPHVTLVRRARTGSVLSFEPVHAEMTADRISLMSSDLSGGRPVYTEIYSRTLG